MKLLGIFIFTLFLGKSCSNEQQQDIAAAVIEYTANTRGFYQKITVQDHKLLITKDRAGKEAPQSITISKSDWEALVMDFQDIDLEGLPTLKSPSEKRFYDGAAIASFKITYKGKTYQTENFDHGNPPAEIEKLVEKINALAQRSNDN
jgi:hypothetical protein